MVTEKIEKFYTDIGCDIVKMIQHRPRGVSKRGIVWASEQIYNERNNFELIQIPREVFNKAKHFYETKEAIRQEYIANKVEMWHKRYMDKCSDFKNLLYLSCTIILYLVFHIILLKYGV